MNRWARDAVAAHVLYIASLRSRTDNIGFLLRPLLFRFLSTTSTHLVVHLLFLVHPLQLSVHFVLPNSRHGYRLRWCATHRCHKVEITDETQIFVLWHALIRFTALNCVGKVLFLTTDVYVPQGKSYGRESFGGVSWPALSCVTVWCSRAYNRQTEQMQQDSKNNRRALHSLPAICCVRRVDLPEARSRISLYTYQGYSSLRT